MNQRNVIILVVLVAGFFGFQAANQEYQRIQKRIETTQAKVDRVADESAAAIADLRRIIASIVDRFSKSTESEKQFQTMVFSEVEKLREQIDKKPEQQQPIVELEQPQPTPELEQKTTTPTIVMHSGHSCGPCINWIAKEQPKWEKAGWFVEVRKEIESTRPWPWFRITNRNGITFEVDGPLTNDNFIDAQRKASK